MRTSIIAVALALSVQLMPALAAGLVQPTGDRGKTLPAGTMAPDFTARDSTGKLRKLSEFRGKIVVLDFWATWCGVCKQALPHLSGLAKQAQGQNVQFALCVWDTDKNFDKWNRSSPPAGIEYLFDPAGKDKGKGIFTASFNQGLGLPSTYVIDKDGKIALGVWGWLASDHYIEDGLRSLGVKLK